MQPINFPESYCSQPSELKNRTILITGACGGIGSVMSKAFANYGATIILLDKHVRALEELYDSIQASDQAPLPAIYPLDLSGATANDYQQLAEAIEKEFGKLDGLLHCATMLGSPTLFEQSDMETWYKVLQVNLNGPYMLSSLCVPLLKKSDNGRLLFSVDNKNGAYWDAYGVSKSALIGLTQQLAKEYEDTSLCVNAVNPGKTRTHLHMSAYPAGDYDGLYAVEDHIQDYLYLMSPHCQHNGQLFSKSTD